jgi:hypothetical protein
MRRIIKNAIKCIHCGDIIESRYRHDFIDLSEFDVARQENALLP